jgi:hypothetical protein
MLIVDIGPLRATQAEIKIVEALVTGDLNQIETGQATSSAWQSLCASTWAFPLGAADASVIAATERLKTLSTICGAATVSDLVGAAA